MSPLIACHLLEIRSDAGLQRRLLHRRTFDLSALVLWLALAGVVGMLLFY